MIFRMDLKTREHRISRQHVPRVRLKQRMELFPLLLILTLSFSTIDLIRSENSQHFNLNSFVRPKVHGSSQVSSSLFAPKEPEYVYNYEEGRGGSVVDDRISSAQRYRSYLSETNAALFEEITKLLEEPTKSGVISARVLENSTSMGDRSWMDSCPYFHPEVLKKSVSSMALKESLDEPTHPFGSDVNTEWREDVGQRYRELVPPKKRPSSNFEGLPRPSEVSRLKSFSEKPSSAPPGKIHDIVLMLDLDKCSLYGNDGNDLGIALQWMDKGYDDVLALYKLLLNPCVVKTYQFLQSQYRSVKVVIYTMRATFLLYRSCFREAIIPLQWNPDWHRDGQLYLPPHVRDAEEVLATYSTEGLPLLDEELVDLRKSLERLLVAREVVRDGLGLSEQPPVVVTATPKDVDVTARRLGLSADHAYLWDDNPRLAGSPRVVTVPPFAALPAAQCRALRSFLDERLPPSSLDADLVDFMLGADPSDRVLHASEGPDGGLEYRIPLAPDRSEPWPVPAPPSSLPPGAARCSCGVGQYVRKVSQIFEKENQGAWGSNDGWASPVTPDLQAPVAPLSRVDASTVATACPQELLLMRPAA